MQRKIFLLACVAVLASTSVVIAGTIHVPADQPTIQAGIDAAVNGDTILVSPGTYPENLRIGSKGVFIIGEGGSSATALAPSYGWCAVFEGELNSEIRGFTFGLEGNATGILSLGGGYCTIAECRFLGISYVRGEGPMRVVRCLFKRAVYGNAIVSTGPNCQVINNTIDGGERGLAIYGPNSIIKNNIIVNQLVYGIWMIHPSSILDYNDFWHNNPDYGGGTTAGSHDLSTDPMFVDAAADDYSLEAGSPCLDAGDPAPEFTDPDGTRNDMGAIATPHCCWPWAEDLNLRPENPMRVVSHAPRFSWRFVDTSGFQAAFQLEVGADTSWDIADMWSTGQILSGDTSVVYGGALLADGTTYYWRIRVSDEAGWGNWRYSSFRMNSKPSVPILNSPISGAPVCLGRVQLFMDNSTDPESDPLAYDFQIFGDSTLTTLIASQSDIKQTPSPTGSDIFATLSSGVEHWWRSRAYDGYEHSEWSSAQWFSAIPRVIRVPVDVSTIAQAVNEACNEDTILIAHGTYLEGINPLGKAIVVAGTLPVESTIVMSAAGTPVVTVANGEGPNTIIRDLTITGAPGLGGVSITASSPQILNNVIRSNVNSYGGGIRINSGNPVIRGNRIIGNSASGNGGGVFVDDWASAVLDSNVFLLNSADGGSAIAKAGRGDLIATGNIMYANSSSGFWGGTIYTERQLSDLSSFQIDHNTIVGNTSTLAKGAGIVNYNPEGGEISNNVIAFNRGGYGLCVVSDSGTPPQVSYNDVWWNDSGAYFGVTPATGNIAADPQFCDTSQQDFHLASTSPCLGTGASGTHIGASDQGCISAIPLQPMAPQIIVDFPNGPDHVVNQTPTICWRYADPGSRPHEESELQIGTDQDWVSIETWQPPIIAGPDTSIQYGGLPLVDGVTYYMRVRVRNDVLWSNWSEISFHMNSQPTLPGLLTPSQGAILHTGRAPLSVASATDPDGDPIAYTFEVYTDSSLTHLAASGSTWFGTTVWTTDSLTSENARHWWRARACDGFECSPWSSVRSFWVDAYPEPPTGLPLRTPPNGVAVFDPRPTFEWDPAVDPDPGSQYIYTLTVSLNPSFTFKQDIMTYLATSFRWPEPLLPDATYWWRVHADNLHGDTITSSARSFRLTTAGDENGDGAVDVFDVIWLIDYTFAGGPPPIPLSLADVNGDCVADVFDIIYLIDHVFSGGPAPVPGCI